MGNRWAKVVLLAAIPAAGCTDSVDVTKFAGYGVGQPGHGLVLGGDVFLELVHMPDGDFGSFNGWARDFSMDPAVIDSLPYIARVPSMTCADVSTPVFPRPPTAGSMFKDLGPEITLRSGAVAHVAPKMTDMIDNLQYGIPQGYQLENFDVSNVVHGAYYDVEFAGSENLHPNQMYFPPKYAILSPPIGKAPVTLNRGEGMTMTWDPVNQDVGNGQHTADRTFTFIAFAAPPTDSGQTKWFCPIDDGAIHDTFTVPPEVFAAFPSGGLIITGQFTHMMAEYEQRRFDLIAIECNRSPFSYAP